MLVGLPGSGKTYWVANRGIDFNTVVVSTDDIIETIGRQVGMTYNEMFNDITYSFAEKMMMHIAKFNINLGKNIIWDQTNLTIKTRKRKIDMFGPDYRKIAVVFPIPQDHEKRLSSRQGKTIPSHVIEGMKKSYQEPTFAEDFDEIRTGLF
jgi:predicted kinase